MWSVNSVCKPSVVSGRRLRVPPAARLTGYGVCGGRGSALSRSSRVPSAFGLYEPGLALRASRPVVGNDVDADLTRLMVVTVANQGGKSTFLRSLGLAQLLMQAGAVALAASYTATVRPGAFTHFKREEDASLTSGKFDERLSRMSEILDLLSPGCLVLLNESFSSTNEREGAQIGSAVITRSSMPGSRSSS